MGDNIKKRKLYIDVVPTEIGTIGKVVTTGTTSDNDGVIYKIKHSDGSLHDTPETDFFINVPIHKTERLYEYIDLKVEDNVFTVERQEFNPQFIEYSFFNTVDRNRINKGEDLNDDNIEFIREVRSEFDPFAPSDNDIRTWYDQDGVFDFPWNKGTENEVTKDDLDKSSIANDSIVSKSTIYPIDINN